jgi:hypothetical protein
MTTPNRAARRADSVRFPYYARSEIAKQWASEDLEDRPPEPTLAELCADASRKALIFGTPWPELGRRAAASLIEQRKWLRRARKGREHAA